MTPQEFCKKYGVKVTGEFLDCTSDSTGWEHTAYKAKVKYKGRPGEIKIKFTYRMGVAHTDFDPMGALYAVSSDANAGGYYFELFCDEFGADSDSIEQHKIWKACRKMRRKAEAFCDSEDMFQDLLALEY